MSLHISKPRDTELSRIAYASVADIPTVEENDRNRLGYHVWLFLRGELTSLEEAIRMARARFKPRDLSHTEVHRIIGLALDKLELDPAKESEAGVQSAKEPNAAVRSESMPTDPPPTQY